MTVNTMLRVFSIAIVASFVVGIAALVPSPSVTDSGATTDPLPQTYTRQTDPPKDPTTEDEFKVPAPVGAPAPFLYPSPGEFLATTCLLVASLPGWHSTRSTH